MLFSIFLSLKESKLISGKKFGIAAFENLDKITSLSLKNMELTENSFVEGTFNNFAIATLDLSFNKITEMGFVKHSCTF